MKLLYITNGVSAPGGLERVLSIKASYFADKLGYDIHIITLNDEVTDSFYEFSEKIHFHNILAKGNPIAYLIAYILGLRKIINMVRPDIISVCDDGLKGFFLPLLLGKPCPMIYERHVSKLISGNSFKSKVLYRIMDKALCLFDRFIVLTEQNKNEWPSDKRIHVISNPLTFYPQKPAALLNKQVIAVGKFGYQKGYDLLIDAWGKVSEQYPDWSLSIYGKPSELSEEVKNKIKEKDLSNVIIHDAVKNIHEKYLESSVYVMSSRYEGFGMVLIEAMACGVPCVSFDCPYGPGDIIAHEEDGILVPNGNIDELSKALVEVIKDKDKRSLLGQNARQNVKRFSLDTIGAQWDSLFKEMLNN